jgi:Fe-S cluster assembly protein SufD
MTNVTSRQIDEATVRAVSERQSEPEWLRRRRFDALRIFETMAMPSGLEEEWRRTDISQLDLEGALSRLAGEPQLGGVSGLLEQAPKMDSSLTTDPALAERSGLDGLLIQQGGRTQQRFTSAGLDPRVLFTDLASAATERPELVETNLGSIVLPTEWKLQSLAAALWSGGCVVHVPRGVEVELPLRYVMFAGSDGVPLFNHLLIVAEEGSGVTVVQEASSPDGENQALVSGAVEILCGADARVRFFDIERWGKPTYSFSTVRARLARGASVTLASIGLGGRLTRSRIEAILEGEGAEARMLGLSFGDSDQHFDYQTLQEHRAPRTVSDLLFKAALSDRASMVWNGTVRIHKGASGSDANQTSRNLLLSDKAKAAPIPVLEIEQYDILRCSHGATAGPLDEDQLFYLESRGIGRPEAEQLLVRAFFHEVLDRVPAEALRAAIEVAVEAKLERAPA